MTDYLDLCRVKGVGGRLARSSPRIGRGAHEAINAKLSGGVGDSKYGGYARGAEAFLEHIDAAVLAVEVPV